MDINTPERQAEHTNLKIDFAFTAAMLSVAEFCLRHNIPPSIIQCDFDVGRQGVDRALAVLAASVFPDFDNAMMTGRHCWNRSPANCGLRFSTPDRSLLVTQACCVLKATPSHSMIDVDTQKIIDITFTQFDHEAPRVYVADITDTRFIIEANYHSMPFVFRRVQWVKQLSGIIKRLSKVE